MLLLQQFKEKTRQLCTLPLSLAALVRFLALGSAALLADTGSSIIVTIAAGMAIALLAWGLAIFRVNK